MINKFQQGGKQQDAIMQFVQGIAQVLQADPNKVIQIAQQNPKALEQAVKVFQQTQDINQAAQAFTQSIQKAKQGAKLNYIKSLKHQCADDEELYYYKKGGSVDCGCKKKEDGGEVVKASTGVELFREDQKKKKQNTQQQSKWTNIEDNELKKLSEKKNLTPQEKQRLQQLRNKFKNSSNTKDYEMEEGKKGMKIKKDCGGAVAKFKKHRQGGSLNGIPFYQGGTNEGGIQSMAELIPIYGTYKAGQRFFRNPSWRTAGEFAVSGLADAAMLTGIGAGAGAALKAGNMAVKAGKVAKAASNLKKIKAARNLKYGQPYGISGYSDDAARTASNLASDALTYGTDYGKAVQQGNKLIRQANWADGAADTYNTAKWMGESALGSGITGALARKK